MGIQKEENSSEESLEQTDFGNEAVLEGISSSKIKKEEEKKSILDELEDIKDENEKFWKTPSSSRMVRGGTLMLTFDIVSSIFFTIYIMQIARAPTRDSALLAIIDTLGLMLRFFAYLGFTGAGAKFMSEYMTRDKKIARIYAKSAAKYNMWATGFPLIITAFILLLTRPETETEFIAYLSLFILIVFDRLTSNITIYILGSQRYDLYAYAYFVPYCAMYISAVITYPLVGVKGPLLSFAIARIFMFISMSFMMGKACDFPYKDLWDWGKDYGLFWKLFKFNFLYSLANLAFSLLTTTLLISGGDWLGILTDQEITALYTISTFSNILMNLFGIVGSIMVNVSEASAVKNKRLVKNYVMIALKFPILMSIAVLTFFILLGPEMISIFQGSRWITIGMLIMSCLMPAYCFGSFASKYDNILAGVGRPETVILPWFVGLFIALIGLFTAKFIPEGYLVDDFIEYQGEILNYGISYKFLYTIIITSLGLLIAGVWVVKICLKVLDVKIPLHFIWKPLITALLCAGILQIFMEFIPIRATFDAWFNPEVGGIVFTVVVVLIGVFLFVTIGLLIDMMNKEDGLFWKSIVEGMGPAKTLLKPIFWYCKILLDHQFSFFKREPTKWVLKTDKETIEANKQFCVDIVDC